MGYYGFDFNTAIDSKNATAYIVVSIVLLLITIIAQWRLFTKAGEKGWKSLIPIYNLVVFLRIIGISPWFILVMCIPFIGFLAYEVYTSIRLAKVFGKGFGTILGLIVFPNVFYLILAFGKAEYLGADYGKE